MALPPTSFNALPLPQVAEALRDCMENAVELRVPLKANVKIGPTWGSMIAEAEFVEKARGKGVAIGQQPALATPRHRRLLYRSAVSADRGSMDSKNSVRVDSLSKPGAADILRRPHMQTFTHASSLLPLFDLADGPRVEQKHPQSPSIKGKALPFAIESPRNDALGRSSSGQLLASPEPKPVQFEQSQGDFF